MANERVPGFRQEICPLCNTLHEAHDNVCDSCGKKLELAMPDDYVEGTSQYRGALELLFRGGFGMYFDYPTEHNPHVLICKECADKLVESNPWIKQFL
jgi:hypothetical protein